MPVCVILGTAVLSDAVLASVRSLQDAYFTIFVDTGSLQSAMLAASIPSTQVCAIMAVADPTRPDWDAAADSRL